jgi:hypothetical protein
MFPSGTQIVTQGIAGEPHLYVFGPADPDEGQCDRNRFHVCEQIADFLNGGARPEWFDQLERRGEESAEDLDGTRIYATGPMIDADPPNLNWVEDDSEDARNKRARLMDRLFGIGGS